MTLIPGDGVGPEITEALILVFQALGQPFHWKHAEMGLGAFEKYGDPLPARTIQSIESTRLAIKGPVETPLISGFQSPLLRLRKHFELFANVRPSQILLKDHLNDDKVDMLMVRENMEGLYSAEETYLPVGDDPHGIAQATAYNSRIGCERILRFAFDLAQTQRRRKVTVVHKANVLKKLSGIFLQTARELYGSSEYAQTFEYEEMIVDACAMQMAMNRSFFDVIVTTNMFGDILSDLAAGLTGGIGMAPCMNIGKNCALFEPVHGSAPGIAGKGIANPIALLLSGALMLLHVGKHDEASRLRSAIDKALNEDLVRTPDLGGNASTYEMATAVARHLG
ncbi:isocitrate/isopropylmalate dehydrogenase family protein [Ferribacterium limneticum]|uniref:isocitrate/isopropylmalate dehydrogenase family protein n=1 Tax=Ferribacterium limneticum TaxID=76259 RepID=UPI001CF94C81|nr:isocitrate/isopropylmalate dehydrogenase family protein [Ferribacterium limneticum]UCV17786.1 isocitrate/isopropylmalate dehydrogenase family protein [Ferribacterium limneticum]